MIKNVIFDMGNVLMHWLPDVFIARLGYSGEDAEMLNNAVFLSPLWQKLDEGTVTPDDVINAAEEALPERLRPAAEQLVNHWFEPMIPVDGMEELAASLKEKGYKLYLLSNAGPHHHTYWPTLPVSRLFDGKLISADVKINKPSPGIYEALFEKFSLNPRECIFIDDVTANIEAGKKLGMEGFVFDGDPAALKTFFVKKGIL